VETPFIPNNTDRNPADRELAITPRNQFLVFLYQYGIPIGIILLAGLVAFGLYRLLEKPIRSKKPLVVYVEESMRARGWRIPRWLQEWSRLAKRTPMEKLFAIVGEMLRVWGKPPDPNLTPAEQVEQLAGLVPEISSQAVVLLEEYQRASYSHHKVDFPLAREAAEEMRSLGYRTWFNRRRRGKVV
jgi:hypothetical protein